jgi:taurine transport system ATP-binding protein
VTRTGRRRAAPLPETGPLQGIEIDGVSMVYPLPGGGSVHALEQISLDVRPGELVSILGPSGCGKTTLLNILAGFLAPTGGRVVVDGAPVVGPGADRGMVFQQGALFEWLSVAGNVGFGPRMAGRPAGESRARVDELLGRVGLAGLGDTPVYQLSGGMQQRVALARCLANDPKVILMDEPLGALDALTREKMQGLVLRLWDETGTTIVLITHSVEEALFLGERLVVMAPRPGRIEKEFRLPFAREALKAEARAVKASPEFVAVREEVLAMIWSMEEQIMGAGSDG